MKSIVLFGFVLSALCAAENVVQYKVDETVMLKCGLTDNVLKWLNGNELLYNINPRNGMTMKGTSNIAQRSKLKNNNNLEILHVKSEDAGQYTCITEGKQQEVQRLLVVSVSVTPSSKLLVGSSAVLQCNVAGLTPGSSVEWVRPNGDRERSHIVNLKSVALSDAGAWACLTNNADGKIMKQAVNIEVMEPPPKTTPAASTTRVTPDNAVPACFNCTNSTTPTRPGLSWWMWATIGGVCLVIVLLWVFVLVMYNRMLRRKRRFMKLRKCAQLKPKQYCQCQGRAAEVGYRQKTSGPPLSVQCH